jgi:hypothetical protein
MGASSTMALVSLDEMKDWQLYEDTEHMNFWYEHRYNPPEEDVFETREQASPRSE